MAETQIVESDSKPVIDYLSLALSLPKTDERFSQCRFQENYTVNAINTNTDTLRYFFDPLPGSATYDLSDLFLMAKIRITDSKDRPLAQDTEASIINNILFSAFRTMKIYLNEYR